MANKIYTVQFDIEGSEADFQRFLRDLKNVPHITEIKTVNTREARVKYPYSGVQNMNNIVLTFTGKVSKDKVEEAIEYWNAIGFVRGVKSVDWLNNTARINFDPNLSPSSDLAKRNILELLLEHVENGSVVRRTHPYGQAVTGIGKDKVVSVVGL